MLNEIFTIQFFLGILASLIASLILFVILQIKTRIILRWGTLKLFWLIVQRLRDNGIINFYTSRSDYVKFRKQSSIADYIETTKKEFIYIGFWLAQGTEMENITSKLFELLKRGCSVELVLLDPKSSHGNKIAEYLGISFENYKARLKTTWEYLIKFKNSLPDDLKPRFLLRSHDKLISSSAFIFDYNTEFAKTLIDIKLYGMGRESSFGIELQPSKMKNSLYYRITKSFLTIRNSSAIVI
jgi:hypothetical protein